MINVLQARLSGKHPVAEGTIRGGEFIDVSATIEQLAIQNRNRRFGSVKKV